jgi:5-methylcytosine-specific restriction protein A
MAYSKESRHSRGYGNQWEKIRKVVIERAKGLCEKCMAEGRVAMGRDVDHKTPKAQAKKLRWSDAKTDHPSNLWYLCVPCHKAKTAEENGQTYRPKVEIGEDGWPIEK